MIELHNIVIDNATPTLISLTHTASPNYRFNGSDSTTITATFSEAMGATPTITIGNGITSQAMSATASAAVWIYDFNVGAWTGIKERRPSLWQETTLQEMPIVETTALPLKLIPLPQQ